MHLLTLSVGLSLVCIAPTAEHDAVAVSDPLFGPLPDLMEDVPEHFTRFYFGQAPEDAQWLSRYLWYHFSKRLGASPCLFNQEYLTLSDVWMGGAFHPVWKDLAQGVLRKNLLAIRLDPEGYVHTHQHFSHAHEQGWPFPLWLQAPPGPEGYTAGWHFQDDGAGWVWDALRQQPDSPFARAKATEGWTLENLVSGGIVDGKWRLESTGPSPALTTPDTVSIDAFNAPFLQLRWTRTGYPKAMPYVEWLREGDGEFGPDRRVYFGFNSGNPEYEKATGATHSMICMHRHPFWEGRIKRIRIALAPAEADAAFAIDSFFTVYDTRHTINNPIYIMACWNYFSWTGDVPFLKSVINNMRLALRYQQTAMGGLKHKHIRNPWPGHDGTPGLVTGPEGAKAVRYGHGVGSNYWDILAFGGDDMYATAQYYAATLVMAEVEEAVLAHPEWDLPGGGLALDPAFLRGHAAAVKERANELFWDKEKGRFVGCIDTEGVAHDYGFTFLNLDAVWYGIASDQHRAAIMDWLTGQRIVPGDTSTADDIYHWRFGPRATTLRNIDWYAFPWTAPESIPWGGQVQDGGAVLGFTFFDLWARLEVLGPDSAWERLCEILEWEREVWSEGGYRAYYADGKRGTTLQGGGTAGGLGIDFEFYESSLVPSIVVYGFLGLEPEAAALRIAPRLPLACPEIGATDILYHGVYMDLKATPDGVTIAVKRRPVEALHIVFDQEMRRSDSGEKGCVFTLSEPGVFCFVGVDARSNEDRRIGD
jgi:hypothetical protein